MNQIKKCANCGHKGTAFNSNLCLSCMANRDKLMREREGRHPSIMSSNKEIYSNYELMNDYLSTLK